jgi:hypothetical protein
MLQTWYLICRAILSVHLFPTNTQKIIRAIYRVYIYIYIYIYDKLSFINIIRKNYNLKKCYIPYHIIQGKFRNI